MPEASEAEKVYAQVEARKRRARELGLDKLLCELWHRHYLYCWPDQIKRLGHQTCPWVADAIDLDSGKAVDESKKETRIKIIVREREYIVGFSEKTYTFPEYSLYGLLEVFSGSGRVLAINLSGQVVEWGTEWSAFDVEAFIEGDWIQDFKHIEKAIVKYSDEQKRREREDPTKVADLKKRFGL